MKLADANLLQGAELLQAQAHIWNHIFNFINSMSLKCAVQLGIPDVIYSHGKPMSLSDLVAALPIHPTKARCVHRLMRILVHSGFFVVQNVSDGHGDSDREGYVLTNASQLLIKDHPLSAAPLVQAMLDPMLTKPGHYVSSWFQSDVPTPFAMAHGRSIWEHAAHEPKLNSFFNEAMASDARLVASVLIDDDCKVVFEGLKTLVDVGGGTGTVAKAIAKAFPHLDCTVFDLPHVVANLQRADNLKFVGGDMFEGVPPADAVILKWILHDWNDEECLKILEQCKEAIKGKEGGKVIIIDMVMENDERAPESIETELLVDILMMILYNGRERNEKELAKLFADAGFSHYKITPILGLRSLIEVYP